MDRSRFDAFARAFATRLDRRTAIAAALGLAAAPVASADAGPGCRKIGKTCSRGSQCCSGVCPTGRGVPIRQRNRCSCGPQLQACGCDRTCVDVLWDPLNCGECGNVCRGFSICDKGQCVALPCGDTVCPMVDGMECCDAACHNLLDDPDHCGACGAACADGEACHRGICMTAGVCDDVVCPMLAGMECCDGACHDLSSDPEHCGSCNRSCSAGQSCRQGVCVRFDPCADVICPTLAGMQCCDGACYDLQSDPSHCGSCNRTCSAGRVCIDGACRLPE